MHGYGIRKHLAERTGGLVVLSFGRLYPLLRALERRKLVRGRDILRGQARIIREYRLTSTGRKELHLRRMLWQQFSHSVNAIMT